MQNMKTTTVIGAVQEVGHKVAVRGWIQTVRDMGKITFIDLRDQTGLLQVVVPDGTKIPQLGLEYVVEVSGTIRERGERFQNPKLATGKVELGVHTITVLNEAVELPFEVKKDTSGINEELRLKYRYLDLRTERMAANGEFQLGAGSHDALVLVLESMIRDERFGNARVSRSLFEHAINSQCRKQTVA